VPTKVRVRRETTSF